MKMAWLEIIQIRAVGSNRELLESQLKLLIDQVNQGAKHTTTKVYKHVTLETDFSIHFFHDSDKTDTKCSFICTRLVASLKNFGLVNHTVWVEKSERGDRNESRK
jgi:hypothetical protein